MIPRNIARQFLEQDEPVNIIPYGNGLINDTWRVETDTQQFILQKINRTVFPKPELIMANLEAINAHLQHYSEATVKLQFPKILKAGEHSYYIDDDDPKGPQLLVKGERLIMPLIVIPLPEEEVDEIEDLIAMKLPEEHLEEPFFAKVLEFFGF